MPTISVLSKNKKNIKIFLRKIFIFYNLNNLCILHGQVFVMLWPLFTFFKSGLTKVKVCNDQEKVQSERGSHSKHPGGNL